MFRRKPEEPIRRSVDRPINRYGQSIAMIINKDLKLSPAEIEKAAQNREAWRKIVLDCSNSVKRAADRLYEKIFKFNLAIF